MANREWTLGSVEEWSVHAQLSFAPQTGNVTLSASDGPSRDSGYSSERPAARQQLGARATCVVTVPGGHTVTLTCSEAVEPVAAAAPQRTTTGGSQVVHFCHHPPADKPHRHYQHYHPPPTPPPVSSPVRESPPPPPPPVLKDVASQTSASNVPLLVQQQSNKRKGRVYQRSPARGKGSPVPTSNGSGSDGKKNPRTVHIDVYCTGSESSSSTSDDDNDTNSTPQTVFESNRVKVVHARARGSALPHALQRQKRRVLSDSQLDAGPVDGSGSTVSSSYPSPRSSLVSDATGGFSLVSDSSLVSSRLSSVNSSSVATSWKDTDLESTRTSCVKSDSFDYENSFDKVRIKEKDKIWGEVRREAGKQLYRRIRARQSNSSESSDEDEEGLAWSFGRREDVASRRPVRREDTVRPANRKASPPSGQPFPPSLPKSGSLSDSEASNLKKFKSAAPTARPPPAHPFHWAKAEKFGPLVNFSKKPGHHVGPSKNPDCSCDTCRYFFEHVCYRNRSRSLGDKGPPMNTQ